MDKLPRLIIVTGRPGAGKTTFAKKLGLLLKFPVFSRDEFKEGYVNTFQVKHSELVSDTNKLVTNTFFEAVESLLQKKISLIIEAAFQHPVWEAFTERINKVSDVTIIVCDAGDALAAKRHLERGLEDPAREHFHGDNRVTHYKKTGEFLEPSEYVAPKLSCTTIVVSTKNEYEPALEKIQKQLAPHSHS